MNLSSSKSENPDDLTVILAYYIDLSAVAVVEPVGDTEIIKGHDSRLKIQFFDGNNNAIDIDSKAVITAFADIVKENKTIASKEIAVIEKSGLYCISDTFTFDDFGEVRIRLNVSFGKNISMDYVFDSFGADDTKIKIIPHSPETIQKYSNDTINAEKIQDGSQTKFLFTIPLKEYIRDIDSSFAEMKVFNYDSYSGNNKFTAYIENESLIIKAENDGVFNCFVELEDESGFTTKLDIEGMIKNMGNTNEFGIVILLICLFLVLIGFFAWFINKKNTITDKSEIRRAVEEKLREITDNRTAQRVAKAVEPIFSEIHYEEDLNNIKVISKESVKEFVKRIKGQQISDIIEQINVPNAGEIVNIVEEVFSEFIFKEHELEIFRTTIDRTVINTSGETKSDSDRSSNTYVSDTSLKTEPASPYNPPIQFSITVKDKKRNKLYRLAKPGMSEENSECRTLGDFDSLSGSKVRELPEKDRPDIDIMFEAGYEDYSPVVYVKSGSEKKVVHEGETLDWLDMEIKLK